MMVYVSEKALILESHSQVYGRLDKKEREDIECYFWGQCGYTSEEKIRNRP